MILNKNNAYLINTPKVYIHDDVLLSLQLNRNKKTIVMDFQRFGTEEKYTMSITNFIGLDITACDYWFPSERVLDFEYATNEDAQLIPKLQSKWSDVPGYNGEVSYDNFIELIFTFISGDVLRIACEKIELINFESFFD